MKHLLSLLLLLLPAAAGAQSLLLRAGGGLSTQYGSARVVGAFKIGLGYEYEFDQHWTLTSSLLFTGKGWKDPDRLVEVIDDDTQQPELDDEGRPVMSTMSRSVAANYVELPVVLNYYFRLGPSRYIVVGAGPYAALGVSGRVKVKGDGRRLGAEKLYYDNSTFSSTAYRRFDAGVQTFIGYQFAAGFTLGLETDFGVLRTAADGGRNLSGLVALSYKF